MVMVNSEFKREKTAPQTVIPWDIAKSVLLDLAKYMIFLLSQIYLFYYYRPSVEKFLVFRHLCMWTEFKIPYDGILDEQEPWTVLLELDYTGLQQPVDKFSEILWVIWYNIGSYKIVMMGGFIAWKLAKATSQGPCLLMEAVRLFPRHPDPK